MPERGDVDRGARRRRASAHLVRESRFDWTMLWRLLAAWGIGSLVLGATIALLPGISAARWVDVVVAALAVELVGAVLRPLLTALAVALSWFGVFVIGLLAQALILFVGLLIAPGITVDSVWWALAAVWITTLLGSVVGWLLSVDREDAFLAHCIREGTRNTPPALGNETGVVMVQLDGLPRPVLDWGLRAGNLPTLGRWVREGTHVAGGWSVRLPSTTPVSQAGILHGRTDDIPAFRWYEKDAGRLMVANRPADATVVESRLSDGRGLLADDGVSISNLFSGDAPTSLLSMSGRHEAAGVTALLGPSRSYAAFFVHPYGFGRAFVRTLGEMLKELFQARRQRLRGIEPRVHRGGAYVALRGVTNSMLRDLNVALVVEHMMRGAKSIYVDFVDYDEIAHHAGPTRPESLAALDGLDRVLGTLERAAREAPRRYEFVVLSDHGQSQGATFRQRYGRPLETVVRDLMGTAPDTLAATGLVEQWGPVNTLLAEVREQSGASARVAQRVLPDHDLGAVGTAGPGPQLVVCGSGNLGLVYLTDRPHRLGLEELEATWPRLVPGLATHPGIAFVLVDSAAGPVVLGAHGAHRLADGAVDGEDPLAPFGARAADDLRRISAYRHAPDLYLGSCFDPATGEVAAFEELVGCHGGLGGWQTEAVLVRPAAWAAPDEPLVGAEAVHRQLVSWLEALGHRRDLAPSDAGQPSSSTVRR